MINGKPYDWTITKKPERPYIHDYTKAFTTKLFLAHPNQDHTGTVVKLNFAQVLSVIQQIDAMTPGIPKIIYLVGWQYFGHDSKYPAWHEVNEELKRPEDKTALDSLLRLFEEASRYHTTLSLHINMWDAYENSPLWRSYLDAGVITLDKDGEPYKTGIWNNIQAYAVNYRREWESGLAKKRIDELCAMLPVREAGTVHIDAMLAVPDPGHGETLERVQEGRAQILRYWRDIGVDVTSEFIYHEGEGSPKRDQLIGLMPLAWHLAQTLPEYIGRPASLICGANAADWYKTSDTKDYAELFGCSANAEALVGERPDDWQPVLFGELMRKNLKFLYLNSLERQRAIVEPDGLRVEFSGRVETTLRFTAEGYKDPRTLRRGCLMQDGDNLLFPSPWYKKDSAIAYSASGGKFEYDLSAIMDWEPDKRIVLRPLTTSGVLADKNITTLRKGRLELELGINGAVLIEAL
jgi:hypothetical protein